MSYIQLELGGKTRGLKFNQMAVITMTNYLDFNNLAATYGYALVYAGLVANCYVKREEPDFNFEQVCDWVETLTPEQLMDVRNCFESTQTFKAMQATQEGEKEEMTKKKQKSNKPKE